MRIVLALLLSFAASLAWSAPRVLVYGDSLSAAYGIAPASGWSALLERRLAEQKPPWQLANASVSGETSAGGRSRLPAVLDRQRPEILILALGANDGLRGLPIKQTTANLKAMVGEARRRGVRVLLVGMRLPPNYGRAYATEFQSLFKTVADEARLPLAPFLLDGIATRPELFQADGLHPVAQAQPVLLENIWRVLAPMLKGR